MKRILSAVVVVPFLFCSGASAQDRVPGAEWNHVSPAQLGWSEAGLSEVQGWAQAKATEMMVVHHGSVVMEWGDTSKRTELASVRKSLLSALIGIAVANRKISLDSTLAELGIDDNPPSLTTAEKQATVRMLLEARSGIYHAALYETKSMAARRPERGSHAPGTFWYYNNWDFNALGTIYEHATGTGIYDAFNEQIARPIGMQDYRPADGTYFTGASSIHRAYPLRMSARDLARFALLYLHKGAWAGRQIVPQEWVRDSTRSYSNVGDAASSPGQGYGYLWWVAQPASSGRMFPDGSFFAHGNGGQYAIVDPADDLVVVSRVDIDRHLPATSQSEIAQLFRLTLKAGHLGQ
jgi:CubicO group peptidase (beta-lactamase class C family)